jgi:hypothetical protein
VIRDELPTPDRLIDHPELASLAMLDTALELATLALAAEQPGLCAWDRTADALIGPDLAIADTLVQQAAALRAVIRCYRRLMATPPPGSSSQPDSEPDNW